MGPALSVVRVNRPDMATSDRGGEAEKVRLWAGSIAAVPRSWAACVSAWERELAGRFRRGTDRVASLARHAVLRHILGEQLGLPPGDVPLTRAVCSDCQVPHGRPEIEVPGISISFSVSSGRWLFGMASNAVFGVDLERADRDIVGVRHLAFTAAEQFQITRYAGAHASDSCSAVAVWVVKEAAAKADGRGLRQDLRELRWLPATTRNPLQTVGAGPARWTGIDGELFGSHRFAALWAGATAPVDTVPVWRWMPLGRLDTRLSTWHTVISLRSIP